MAAAPASRDRPCRMRGRDPAQIRRRRPATFAQRAPAYDHHQQQGDGRDAAPMDRQRQRPATTAAMQPSRPSPRWRCRIALHRRARRDRQRYAAASNTAAPTCAQPCEHDDRPPAASQVAEQRQHRRMPPTAARRQPRTTREPREHDEDRGDQPAIVGVDVRGQVNAMPRTARSPTAVRPVAASMRLARSCAASAGPALMPARRASRPRPIPSRFRRQAPDTPAACAAHIVWVVAGINRERAGSMPNCLMAASSIPWLRLAASAFDAVIADAFRDGVALTRGEHAAAPRTVQHPRGVVGGTRPRRTTRARSRRVWLVTTTGR